MLAERVRRVIAIEIDPGLCRRLKDEFAGHDNIELVNEDALRYSFGGLDEFKVVANIPYYITTPILFRLIEERKKLRSVTVTIQKEVAERIVAGPGGKDYGVLSLMIQYYGRPELRFVVPKGAFRPVPKVDSAVIHIEILERPAVRVLDERLFFRVIRMAFAQRRKTLANALKSITDETVSSEGKPAGIREILMLAGIEPMRRAETLSIEDFARVSDMIFLKNRPDPGGRPAL